MQNGVDIGCLLIGDGLFEPDALDGWDQYLNERGVRAEVFRWPGPADLHMSLQRAYQRVRRDGAVNAIVAAGSGCDCALALASQLPADRLALLCPADWSGNGGLAKPLGRIRRYALRGAAFCVADVLLLPGMHTPERLIERWRRALCGCRVNVVCPGGDMWTNRKEVLKLGVFRFLCDGITPKSLAENPEMCIIYG